MTDLMVLSHKLHGIIGARVLALGDIMLDRFVYGDADRLSPEAPIPVLKIRREQVMPGGAGNMVRNVATLGATGTLIGVVGEDEAATMLRSRIADQERFRARLISGPDRTTTVKSRFVVGGQQLLRTDFEDTRPVEGDLAKQVLEIYESEIDAADIVVLSDYAKGLLSDVVLRPAIEMAQSRGKPIIADPKSRDFSRYRGVGVLLPNALELTLATGMPCDTDEEAAAAAAVAIRDAGIDNVLVTRSSRGMTLATRDAEPIRLPARAREVHDVSGAGDTVVATLSVALAAGFDLESAAKLANVAAGIVVAKVGTAAVYLDDLVEALQSADVMSLSAEVVTLERALEQVERWRAVGHRIGFTNGCFDLIHPGHVSMLTQAKSACDRLIVGLNTDDSTRRLKGAGRPIQSETARAIVLASLGAVDLVIPFDEDTPIELIRAIRPDVLVKGADYTKDQVVGADVVAGYGGQVMLARIESGYSTTRTIARVGES